MTENFAYRTEGGELALRQRKLVRESLLKSSSTSGLAHSAKAADFLLDAYERFLSADDDVLVVPPAIEGSPEFRSAVFFSVGMLILDIIGAGIDVAEVMLGEQAGTARPMNLTDHDDLLEFSRLLLRSPCWKSAEVETGRATVH